MYQIYFDFSVTNYSRTPIIRTPIIRNTYYPNTTLTKEIRTWQEALERQLRLREKMRPKTNKQLTRARRAVFTVYNIGKATTEWVLFNTTVVPEKNERLGSE